MLVVGQHWLYESSKMLYAQAKAKGLPGCRAEHTRTDTNFVVNEGNMIWILLLWLHTLHAKNEKVAAAASLPESPRRAAEVDCGGGGTWMQRVLNFRVVRRGG